MKLMTIGASTINEWVIMKQIWQNKVRKKTNGNNYNIGKVRNLKE